MYIMEHVYGMHIHICIHTYNFDVLEMMSAQYCRNYCHMILMGRHPCPQEGKEGEKDWEVLVSHDWGIQL